MIPEQTAECKGPLLLASTPVAVISDRMLHTRKIAVSVVAKGLEVQIIAGKKGADYAVDQ